MRVDQARHQSAAAKIDLLVAGTGPDMFRDLAHAIAFDHDARAFAALGAAASSRAALRRISRGTI
jgi:hypothetical protein